LHLKRALFDCELFGGLKRAVRCISNWHNPHNKPSVSDTIAIDAKHLGMDLICVCDYLTLLLQRLRQRGRLCFELARG
jgi:hypothetical protein